MHADLHTMSDVEGVSLPLTKESSKRTPLYSQQWPCGVCQDRVQSFHSSGEPRCPAASFVRLSRSLTSIGRDLKVNPLHGHDSKPAGDTVCTVPDKSTMEQRSTWSFAKLTSRETTSSSMASLKIFYAPGSIFCSSVDGRERMLPTGGSEAAVVDAGPQFASGGTVVPTPTAPTTIGLKRKAPHDSVDAEYVCCCCRLLLIVTLTHAGRYPANAIM